MTSPRIFQGLPRCRPLYGTATPGISALARRTLTSYPIHSWSLNPSSTNAANDEVARLAASRRRPLTLADLLK